MKTIKYLKQSFKQLLSNPLNSFINIFGLGIGLGVFILMMLYVDYQNSFNKFHRNIDKIYRIEASLGGITPPSYYPFFTGKLPQIEKGCRIVNMSNLLNYTKPGHHKSPGFQASIFAVDTTFFDIFTYPVVSGSLDQLFESYKNIALTEKVAHKLFGDENPINKVIAYGTNEITVKVVLKDVPENSSLQFDAIKPFSYQSIDDANWGRWFLETYVMVEKHDVSRVEKQMDELNLQRYKDKGDDYEEVPYHIKLSPYEDIYFEGERGYHVKGKKSHNLIFTLVAIFVLLIACINYINLATASATTRLKELAMRKISGANRRNIITQILSESVLIAFLSVLLAVLMIEFSLPFFRNLTDKAIYLDYTAGTVIALLVVVPLVLGIFAGLYPSIHMSRFNVLEVLKGKWVYGKSGAHFRRVLTIVQFAISIFLIIGTLFVNRQLHYIQNYDPGYDTEEFITFYANNPIRDHMAAFKSRINKIPGVTGMTAMNTNINSVSWVSSVKLDKTYYGGNDNPSVGHLLIDTSFMRLFDVQLLKGRTFSPSAANGDKATILINEKFVDMLKTDSVLGMKVNGNEVIGVVEDIKTNSLYDGKQPFILQLGNDKYSYVGYIKMNMNNHKEILAEIEKGWKEFSPDYPFEPQFLNDKLMKMYEDDIRFGKAFLIFSIISILIACLGLFALVAFITERKTKEIGIRKTLGATSGGIIHLLIRQFTVWVLVANLIAWPAAYFFLQNWLRNFNEHINLNFVFFATAGLISFVIAILTISYKASRAARANPVNSLRYE